MIIPESRDPEQVMNILLIEVRALTEAFKEFKEDRKALFAEHIKDCKGDMAEVYVRLRTVEEKAAKCDHMEEQRILNKKVAPHWKLTQATYWLVGVTGLLVVEVLMNLYRFWKGFH